VAKRNFQKINRADLDRLMAALEVDFVKLAECLVSPGWRLILAGSGATGIHYNLGEPGRLMVGNREPVDIPPHTLVIAPRGEQIVIETPIGGGSQSSMRTVEGALPQIQPDSIGRFVAGEGEPRVMLICGYFNALFGSSIDLFSALPSPIVEHFVANDQIDQKLLAAFSELVSQEIGTGAMAAALLKQVLITLLRRSLSDVNLWLERFSILTDSQIARAFADMVARPGAAHSVNALAREVGLSRSVFMTRFTNCFGRSPMTVLREIRMRQAKQLLTNGDRPIEQILSEVGYSSRSSFVRAFRAAYGQDPTSYRKMTFASRSGNIEDALS
jgi:AraC family transcriptional regulator, activator of mtrCDE